MQNLHDFLTLAAWAFVVLVLAVLLTAEAFALLDRLLAFLASVRAKRVGGITFFRAGRYRASFCVSNRNLEA